ncbi:hypothetical protein, partial [Aeromonas dhakensis]|uniref:hypothetical protein n=1 Tax=Aeromonas dhakensis TaxID=196024 RepID=UPI0039B7210E
AAIHPDPAYPADLIVYWWTDGSFSEWNLKEQRFRPSGTNHNWFLERGFPVGKQVAAVYPNPIEPHITSYWMTDGSYYHWYNDRQKFDGYSSPTTPQWFLERGFPAGKRVAAIYPNPTNSNLTLYWMTDGTYSDWDSTQQRFTYHSPIASVPNWFGVRGWPAGKRVTAIYPNPVNPDLSIYWMTDGTYSDWDNNLQRFIYHSPMAPLRWFVDRGWPKVSFDPSKYEVRDIRINEHSPNGGAIYANGKMQYKVVVRVQIQDSDGKGVYLGDRGTGGNQA